VLLLHEATAALDPASVTAVESLISARIRAGLAVLWVTHDVEQARRIAVRRLVVSDGQAREEVAECPAISR
jgi:phosphate-transporting ATPase